MTKIRVKNFGPIRSGRIDNDGWIEVPKNTVFIGNQGSGKSTIAKLLSVFLWTEKTLYRGDYQTNWFQENDKFENYLLKYHRLDNYIDSSSTEIEYKGTFCEIKYIKGNLTISLIDDVPDYLLPQIMYVPSERNFISYVKSPKELKLSSESLMDFLAEFDNAKLALKKNISLPTNNTFLEYDKLNDRLNVQGNGYKVELSESSSGFQSLIPLFLVTEYLTKLVSDSKDGEKMNFEQESRFKKGFQEIWNNKFMTEKQKQLAISSLASKFNKKSFINIVEEPEQNLYPESQFSLLKRLVHSNNVEKANKLIITTHSPYIINYFSLLIQGGILRERISDKISLIKKLHSLLPLSTLISAKDVAIYELDDNDGVVTRLNDYEGIPSDSNLLNKSLNEANDLFDALLEIEQELV